MRDDFKIDLARRDDWLIVAVHGELDLATVPQLATALEDATASDAARIVIDLAGITFIDSTGLRCLIEASASSRSNGDRLRFANPQGVVERLLKLCGADTQLTFLDAD